MSSYHKAKLIANRTSGIHEGVAKVMQLCTEIAEERDELKSQLAECKRQRDEALGKSPLYEKNKAEAEAIPGDLKPALILALCQRDVAMRSVLKIHAISKLLNVWNNEETNGDGSVEADADLISEVNRIIKKGL